MCREGLSSEQAQNAPKKNREITLASSRAAVIFFSFRILLKNRVCPERQNCSPDGANESKPNGCLAGSAEREGHVFVQGGLMHEAMLIVLHGINAADWNPLPRHVDVAVQFIPE